MCVSNKLIFLCVKLELSSYQCCINGTVFVIFRCARSTPAENELLVCIALFNTTNIPFPVGLNSCKNGSPASQTSLPLVINSFLISSHCWERNIFISRVILLILMSFTYWLTHVFNQAKKIQYVLHMIFIML